ncbi:unnamed protein product [Cuscuta campestris]|uniref:Helitron helicase-like domain-containing protein n=1 Tax=Cuscuta campestris TaxID=132261 RepID=A0A484MLX4_9ASTE|nr:unnamed protein product [Cuscuta campestris]
MRSIAVICLHVHLPGEQLLTLKDTQNIAEVVNDDTAQQTMFTQWLERNSHDAEARALTYVEFPSKFVWNQRVRVWSGEHQQLKYVKQWTKRKQGNCLGRIAYVHPTAGERYYLRLLLNSTRGPTSYEDIRTINNVLHPTFKAACYALGLLSDDKEWIEAIQEANEWATANQARELFVTILLFYEVTDPTQFWENTKNILQDDILHRRRKMYRHPDLHLTPTQIQTYCLLELDKILQRFGKTLSDFPSLPQPSISEISSLDNRMIREELSYNITEKRPPIHTPHSQYSLQGGLQQYYPGKRQYKSNTAERQHH